MRYAVLKVMLVGVSLSVVPALASTPDGLITSKAKLALWTTAGVRSTAVHVDTDEGVVTLYGKVPTEAQKAAAEKTVHAINGVRGVTDLMRVVPEAAEKRVAQSDHDTMALAEKRLKADVALKDSSISVKAVDDGVVLLSGEARTLSDHLRAVFIVDRLPGVRRVASEVKGPDGFGEDERVTFLSQSNSSPQPKAKASKTHSSATDMRISAEVKLRLLTASQVPSNEISVDTDDGVVVLFGMVPTAQVKNAAAIEARKVSGVTGVENQLEVVATSQRERVEAKDADITRDLALVFKDRPELKGVDTAVKNGVVRLVGTVGSSWDEVNAVRLARKVPGVRGVEDQLKVSEKSETSRRE